MRLFVAIDIDDDARRAIAALKARVVAACAVSRRACLKWVHPEHQHVTLVFLGEIAEGRVTPIVRGMSGGVSVRPFTLGLGGLVMFPARGTPRVLSLGVTGGEEALAAVHQRLAERLKGLGVVLDDRPFHPHLTLARWRDSGTDDRHCIATVGGVEAVARVRVESAALYESRLSPLGPTYRALARAQLGSE
jgi:2'-5' RNA ligase